MQQQSDKKMILESNVLIYQSDKKPTFFVNI